MDSSNLIEQSEITYYTRLKSWSEETYNIVKDAIYIRLLDIYTIGMDYFKCKKLVHIKIISVVKTTFIPTCEKMDVHSRHYNSFDLRFAVLQD